MPSDATQIDEAATTTLRLHGLQSDYERYLNYSISVGDVLQFFDKTTANLTGEANFTIPDMLLCTFGQDWYLTLSYVDFLERVVLSIRSDLVPGSKPNRNGSTIVSIAGVLPPWFKTGRVSTSDPKGATQIYNLNASATQFVFRGNKVRNGRRFGVLAKGLRLLVENNSFEGLGSGKGIVTIESGEI